MKWFNTFGLNLYIYSMMSLFVFVIVLLSLNYDANKNLNDASGLTVAMIARVALTITFLLWMLIR